MTNKQRRNHHFSRSYFQLIHILELLPLCQHKIPLKNPLDSKDTRCSSAGSASTCPSPSAYRNQNDTFFDSSGSQETSPTSPLQLVQPRALLSPYPPEGASASPPRSNSIDISILRKDIELLSVSSGDSASGDDEFEPPSLADSIRTNRSRLVSNCQLVSRTSHYDTNFGKTNEKRGSFQAYPTPISIYASWHYIVGFTNNRQFHSIIYIPEILTRTD